MLRKLQQQLVMNLLLYNKRTIYTLHNCFQKLEIVFVLEKTSSWNNSEEIKKKKQAGVTKNRSKKENHTKICKAYLKKCLLEKQNFVIAAHYDKDCNYNIIVSKIHKQLYY